MSEDQQMALDDWLARVLGWYPWEVHAPGQWLFDLEDDVDEAHYEIGEAAYAAHKRLNELEAALLPDFFARRDQLLFPPHGCRRNAHLADGFPRLTYY